MAELLIRNKTVCCIASGPSLTKEDCEAVYEKGIPIIAVNSSWKFAPYCDFIYGGDAAWWMANQEEVMAEAEYAEFWTSSENFSKRNYINYYKPATGGFWNSGMRAIEFAISHGASRVILLGYDCSVKHGIHCHGPHAETSNPTEANTAKWKRQFAVLDTRGCEVVNCSRYTEIDCFRKENLESALLC